MGLLFAGLADFIKDAKSRRYTSKSCIFSSMASVEALGSFKDIIHESLIIHI
ncbi:MAG: hypothetical protein FWF23_05390 [Alphaproteobacteria bacterium]|nr:hypothetical protein [Alphaproteobacteria bacterium]MCL2504982.1 hypothetical protein [Alphaproteobacteria bacterium]